LALFLDEEEGALTDEEIAYEKGTKRKTMSRAIGSNLGPRYNYLFAAA
jgi:hypothetical protein